MKTFIKNTFLIVLFSSLLSCNDESLIEGMIPTKPVVTEVNRSFNKNSGQQILYLNIDNIDYLIVINYISNYNFYVVMQPVQSPSGYIGFSYFTGSNYIGHVPFDYEIDESIDYRITSVLTSGRYYSNMTWSYDYNNNTVFDNEYYLPFKIIGNNENPTCFGWILVYLDSDYLEVKKFAYVKNRSIKAGEE